MFNDKRLDAIEASIKEFDHQYYKALEMVQQRLERKIREVRNDCACNNKQDPRIGDLKFPIGTIVYINDSYECFSLENGVRTINCSVRRDGKVVSVHRMVASRLMDDSYNGIYSYDVVSANIIYRYVPEKCLEEIDSCS